VLVKASSVVRPATVGGIAGFLLLIMSSNVFGASVAQLSSHAAPTKPSACAKRPQSAVLAAAVSPSASTTDPPTTDPPTTDPSGTAAPHPTPTVSESTIVSPTKSAGPIASPTATATATQAPPPPTTTSDPPSSPKPTRTPTPTPSVSSPSPSPSGTSPSPSPSPGQPQLCVQVQSLSGSPQVKAGHTAGFVVWVWSVGEASNSVTVTAKVATAKNIGAPKFTVCPQASGATCTLGTLPANQADELQAVSAVEPHATSTEHVELTATATGKNASSGSATGSLAVTAETPTGTTSPPAAGGQGQSIPPEPVLPLPGIPDPPGTVGNPAGLFPTVAPIPGATSPSIGFPPAQKPAGHRSSAETASSIVPLDPRLIGGQLAGLAVLAGASTIAIARLSLRRPRPQDGSPDQRDDD
jgi:hypothetical protein